MKKILLTKDKFTIIDNKDFTFVSKRKWYFHNIGYAISYENGKIIYLHRFIMNTPKGMDTDHINGDKLDNRRSNLRICTTSQNLRNKCKTLQNKSSIYKGVSIEKGKNKYRTSIHLKGKEVKINGFDNEIDAAICYDLWAKDLFGKFAKLNFETV